ncbi:MAG: hypothetical protein KC590_00235 [Nitrospira sp.]|nr:hypothetical protein [Nitrospira sp.]
MNNGNDTNFSTPWRTTPWWTMPIWWNRGKRFGYNRPIPRWIEQKNGTPHAQWRCANPVQCAYPAQAELSPDSVVDTEVQVRTI